MKQINIVNAYKLLDSFVNVDGLTDQEHWSLYQLRIKLRSHIDFYAEREQAIKDKYLSFASEDGTLEGAKANEYVKEIDSLNAMEVDFSDFVKPQIRLVKDISFITAEQLSDFIEFIPC